MSWLWSLKNEYNSRRDSIICVQYLSHKKLLKFSIDSSCFIISSKNALHYNFTNMSFSISTLDQISNFVSSFMEASLLSLLRCNPHLLGAIILSHKTTFSLKSAISWWVKYSIKATDDRSQLLYDYVHVTYSFVKTFLKSTQELRPHYVRLAEMSARFPKILCNTSSSRIRKYRLWYVKVRRGGCKSCVRGCGGGGGTGPGETQRGRTTSSTVHWPTDAGWPTALTGYVTDDSLLLCVVECERAKPARRFLRSLANGIFGLLRDIWAESDFATKKNGIL